ncbi:MAG TPA: hypothetical protein VGF65_11225 [Mycobacterium sp.]
MRFPRDIDIRSGAFCLFAFVVVTTFGLLGVIGISCRVMGNQGSCFSPEAISTIRAWVENMIAVLLALMAGSRSPPPGPPP